MNHTAVMVALLSVATSLFAHSQPFLHPLFTDNMVLQRDTPDKVWGWTTPGATVTVSINDQTNAATAAADGLWQVTVGPFAVGGPCALTVSGPESVTLTNVVFGDVILCSGQSNLERYLGVNVQEPDILNFQAEAAMATNANIRQFLVPENNMAQLQAAFSGGNWQPCDPASVLDFTAVGYFTAKYLTAATNVPIGIIDASVGGTAGQCWMDPETLSQLADFSQAVFDLAGQRNMAYANNDVPATELYNAMIAPLTNFSVRAVIWYQGESNVAQWQQYNELLPALVRGWRARFGRPNLPFIICQLANYGDAQTMPAEYGNSFEGVREAQWNTVANDPYSRLAVLIDLGRTHSDSTAFVDIHQPDKEQNGQRCAWALLDLAYGLPFSSQGPCLSHVSAQGTNMVCTFTNVGAGLVAGWFAELSPVMPTNGPLTGFAIAGADGNYYYAAATITASNQIAVTSSAVPNPVSVRYGWGFNPPCNLYALVTNASGVVDGLPASPFRTDPLYGLSVNNGTGSNFNLTPGATVSVDCAPPEGETFAYWSGDIAALSATNASSATVTMVQPYVAIFANCAITSAPASVVISATNGKVVLSWTALSGAHYNIKRAASTSGPFTMLAQNVNATNFADVTASNNVTWFYEIAATNVVGQGPDTAMVSATPLGPALSDLTATPGDNRVELAWTVGDASISGNMIVERSTVSGGPYAPIASVSTSYFLDVAVTNGVTYYYVVSATNSAGQALASAEAGATLQEPVPQIGNPGFENPPTVSQAFQPTGACWAFTPVSGVCTNGSEYTSGNPFAPQGTQVGFLEANGTISQTLSPFIPGRIYRITFSAAQPGNTTAPPQSFSVQIDGINLGTFSPPPGATNYYDYSVFFTATAARHRLSFVGGTFTDNWVLLDNVRIAMLPATGLTANSAINAGLLQLAWPTNYSGWMLQAQTNSLQNGLGTNWVNFFECKLTNQISLPIDASNGCVFFRLISP